MKIIQIEEHSMRIYLDTLGYEAMIPPCIRQVLIIPQNKYDNLIITWDQGTLVNNKAQVASYVLAN